MTIEVDELSDSQDREESKKSGGPGQFLLLIIKVDVSTGVRW